MIKKKTPDFVHQSQALVIFVEVGSGPER